MICVFFKPVDKLNHTLYTALKECDKHFTSIAEYNKYLDSLPMGKKRKLNAMFF